MSVETVGILPSAARRAEREQRHAEMIAGLRREHPDFPDSYWTDVAKQRRLQWQIDDLSHAIFWTAGYYGSRAEFTDNTDLAEMAATLQQAAETIREQSSV